MSAALAVGLQVTMTLANVSKREFSIRVEHTQGRAEDVGSAWVGLYEDGAVALNMFTAYYWMTSGELDEKTEVKSGDTPKAPARTLKITAPRCGRWVLRAFPFRSSYSPSSYLEVKLEGEDYVSMRVDPDTPARLHVTALVSTVDPSSGKNVWVGVYFQDELNRNQYRRYFWLNSLGTSNFECKTPIHKGTYVARLYVVNQSRELAVSTPLVLPDRL